MKMVYFVATNSGGASGWDDDTIKGFVSWMVALLSFVIVLVLVVVVTREC